MPKKKQLTKRNDAIKKKFASYCKKYPHFKTDYIIQKIADEFYLTARSVYGIISKKETNEGTTTKN